MTIDQTFGESMRFVRKAQNLTIEALAKRAGLSADRVRKIDSGESAAYLNEAKAISDALGVTVDALMRGAIARKNLGVYRNAGQKLPTSNQSNKWDETQVSTTHD